MISSCFIKGLVFFLKGFCPILLVSVSVQGSCKDFGDVAQSGTSKEMSWTVADFTF